MNDLAQSVARVQTLSFDCYGTLIDWKKGLGEMIASLLGPAAKKKHQTAFYGAYLQSEAEQEAGPYRRYRDILVDASLMAARCAGAKIRDHQTQDMPNRLMAWEPFPDTNDALVQLQTRYRLGVLSNIDRDLFAATAKHFPIDFDFVITAEDTKTYKPNLDHFQRLLKSHVEKVSSHLHVAQSLFHDGEPCAKLGIPFVWINRYDDTPTGTARPLAVFRDLRSFAEMMT